MNLQKKIAAINDISCLGKCSLTVALPLLSAAGFETCPIPTAVLSTHTGGFTGYTFHDLTDQLPLISNHWDSLNVRFDAVYSGYLGSFKQLDFSRKFIESHKSDSFILIDPVMGDHGRLYSGFDETFARGMANICRYADVIVPNITEACFMTNTPYVHGVHSEDYILNLLSKLSALTSGSIVLTGVSFNDNEIGTACYKNGTVSYIFREKLNVAFHGTGDVFASCLLAALMKGFTLENATAKAVDFVVMCIRKTKETVGTKHYGVNFELCMKEFISMLEI